MNESTSIIVERGNSVGRVVINRPERRNAIDQQTRVALNQAFEELQSDDSVRVVVLTGAGPAFCAGVDLSETGTAARPLRPGTRLVDPVERCELPVIAAVNGAAVGGGFELALAADMRIATDTAFFQLTELRLGSLPGSGGTQRLFNVLPQAVAWKALATGSRITAEEASHHGLVSDVYPVDAFDEAVDELAESVASAAPLSLRATKLAARAALEAPLAAGMTLERALWSSLADTADREEGRAAFREKRPPVYRGL